MIKDPQYSWTFVEINVKLFDMLATSLLININCCRWIHNYNKTRKKVILLFSVILVLIKCIYSGFILSKYNISFPSNCLIFQSYTSSGRLIGPSLQASFYSLLHHTLSLSGSKAPAFTHSVIARGFLTSSLAAKQKYYETNALLSGAVDSFVFSVVVNAIIASEEKVSLELEHMLNLGLKLVKGTSCMWVLSWKYFSLQTHILIICIKF